MPKLLRISLFACTLCLFIYGSVAARTYFMPDYQKELTGKNTGRVNDGGAKRQEKTCGQYGKKSSCAPKIGKGVSHPLPGLTCYDECVDCSTYGKVASCLSPQVGENPSQPIKGLKCYDRCVCPGQYKYSESNCIAPAKLGGDICLKNGGLLAGSSSTSSTRKPSSLTSSAQMGAGALYTDCTCSDEYKFDYELTGEICTSCTGRKGTKFGTFYQCTICTGFNCMKCPDGGNCSQCVHDHTKIKLSGCNASQGWKQSAINSCSCEAMQCPVGYENTISACASNSTKPDLVCSGMSGGKKCCLCKCNNINSSCTAANYPYTSVPGNATKTAECSTGCGSEKVTRYQIKCNSGYVLKNGKCLSDACPTGYNKTACNTSTQDVADTQTSEAGSKCYKCKCKDGYKDVNGTCTMKTCKDLSNSYYDAVQEDMECNVAATLANGNKCYTCEERESTRCGVQFLGASMTMSNDSVLPEYCAFDHGPGLECSGCVDSCQTYKRNLAVNKSFVNGCVFKEGPYSGGGEYGNTTEESGGTRCVNPDIKKGTMTMCDTQKETTYKKNINFICHYRINGKEVYAVLKQTCQGETQEKGPYNGTKNMIELPCSKLIETLSGVADGKCPNTYKVTNICDPEKSRYTIQDIECEEPWGRRYVTDQHSGNSSGGVGGSLMDKNTSGLQTAIP